MAIKISFINFKGGVGKTTLAVNFAATLGKKDYKTLLVDLDPQANASIYLLSPELMERRISKDGGETHKTTYQMFLDIIEQTHKFNFDEAVIECVVRDERGNVLNTNLDLLPNTYEAIDLEYKLRAYQGVAASILKRQMRNSPAEDRYDFIIFDCPPNLYMTTVNALVYSDYFIIPVYPDPFSYFGLDVLCKEIQRRIRDNIDVVGSNPPKLLAVIFSRVKRQATHFITQNKAQFERLIEELKKSEDLRIVSEITEIFSDEDLMFGDTVVVPDSVDKHIPVVHGKQSHEQIKKYTETMDRIVDRILEKISSEHPYVIRR